MKKTTTTRTGRSNVRLRISYEGKERPPMSASKLNRFEAALSDNLRRLKTGGVATAEKCSGEYCYNKVQDAKRLAAVFGVHLKCAPSRCSWEKINGRWTRVCTLDCKDGQGIVVSGTL